MRIGLLACWTLLGCVAAMAAPALGAELVPGGYMAGQPTIATTPDLGWDVPSFQASRLKPEMQLGFTPRSGTSMLVESRGTGQASPLTARFGIAGGEGLDRLGTMGFASASTLSQATRAQDPAQGGLTIGGALTWSDWMIGGAVARGSLFGAETDLFGATLGYGPLTAKLSYGQSSGIGTRADRELWLFSTDLTASSWLTLEGDFAVTSDGRETEPATVGRVGVKLSF